MRVIAPAEREHMPGSWRPVLGPFTQLTTCEAVIDDPPAVVRRAGTVSVERLTDGYWIVGYVMPVLGVVS
jgi:hypothetical protein